MVPRRSAVRCLFFDRETEKIETAIECLQEYRPAARSRKM
jgi:hypothetical protein